MHHADCSRSCCAASGGAISSAEVKRLSASLYSPASHSAFPSSYSAQRQHGSRRVIAST